MPPRFMAGPKANGKSMVEHTHRMTETIQAYSIN